MKRKQNKEYKFTDRFYLSPIVSLIFIVSSIIFIILIMIGWFSIILTCLIVFSYLGIYFKWANFRDNQETNKNGGRKVNRLREKVERPKGI